jgi:hypothetical protein
MSAEPIDSDGAFNDTEVPSAMTRNVQGPGSRLTPIVVQALGVEPFARWVTA